MTTLVDAQITPPIERILPNEPVASSYVDGGLSPIYLTQNTLYEQKRSNLINDFDSAGILTATSQIAYYRVRLNGGRGAGATETATVELRLTLVETASGSATVTIRQGANSTTYSYTTDETDSVVVVGDLTIDDDATTNDYLDFEIEITASSNMATTEVYGVTIFYKRARTSLVVGAYQTGYIPNETSRAAGNAALSTPRLKVLHRNAQYLFEERVGNVRGTSYARSSHPSESMIRFSAKVPAGVTELTLWARLASGPGDFTVASSYDLLSPSPSSGWNRYDLTVVPESGNTSGRRRVFFSAVGETVVVESLCAYWKNATLPMVG